MPKLLIRQLASVIEGMDALTLIHDSTLRDPVDITSGDLRYA